MQRNALVLIEFERFNSGDVKGTITDALRYHFVVPNDVRRYHLISISYISLPPCHGTILFTDLPDPSACIASWKASLLTIAQLVYASPKLREQL
jgi:hypothetical protein